MNIPDPHGPEAGDRVGPYLLLECLGRGAMGEVWRAEQSEPIRRIVALKILKRGMDSREVLTRFEIERQALVRMDHPGIARIYDAGTTEGGQPYIAMEYVAGEDLTSYCDRTNLGIPGRLELVRQICAAVQHAHQKAVLHRDLKPTNILIVEQEGRAVVKIIDFGVAKALEEPLTDRTAATYLGQIVGTPLYMSPEQVAMTPSGVDTRADVYSIGVILYELLVGALPHDPDRLANAAIDEVLRVLREEDPQRPSTRASSLGHRRADIAAHRQLDPRAFVGVLRGDLDWIALKALHKDRDRRYQSPQELAADLERYHRAQPVQARPPSLAYVSSRFVRRHRTGVAMAALVLVAIVAFGLWQQVQSAQLAQARDRALANERTSLGREQLAKDPTAALAYAISSMEIVDQPSARDLVRKALAFGRIRDEWPRHGQRGNPLDLDVSHDGTSCAVAWSQTRHPTVGIYDVRSLEMQTLVAPTLGTAWGVAFNADATLVVAVGDAGLEVFRTVDGSHLLSASPPLGVDGLTLHATDDPDHIVIGTARREQATVFHSFDLRSGEFTSLGASRSRHDPAVEFHAAAVDPQRRALVDFEGNELYLQRFDDLGRDRARLVGRHPALVSAVALDRSLHTAASMDVSGEIRVWDLGEQPPTMLRRYRRPPGPYTLEFDPYRPRLRAAWGNALLSVFDLRTHPPRAGVELSDRSFWTHDGAFLPDGSILTARNGVGVAHWRVLSPIDWTYAIEDSLGASCDFELSADGRSLYMWARNGQLFDMPLVEGDHRTLTEIARTPAWNSGTYFGFFVSHEGARVVSYSGDDNLLRVTGEGQSSTFHRDPVEEPLILWGHSSDGSRAALIDYPDGLGDDHLIRVFDVDSKQWLAALNRGGAFYSGIDFDSTVAMVGLARDHIVRWDLTDPSAAPDTLWRGDGSRGGSVLNRGRAAVVRDADRQLHWVDLVDDREIDLGPTPHRGITSVDFDAERQLLAVAGWWGSTYVFDLARGQRWILPSLDRAASTPTKVRFDPRGRWLIALHPGQLVAWKLPLDDLFADLPAEQLLDRLHKLTNCRVVADATAPEGFRLTSTFDVE